MYIQKKFRTKNQKYIFHDGLDKLELLNNCELFINLSFFYCFITLVIETTLFNRQSGDTADIVKIFMLKKW